MVRNNPTFQRIVEAETARTGSSARAFGRACVLQGFLAAVAWGDWQHPRRSPAPATYYRHKADLHRARLVPIRSSDALAQIARDLGLTRPNDLARLLWAFDPRPARSFAAAKALWEPVIAAALAQGNGGLDIATDSPTV